MSLVRGFQGALEEAVEKPGWNSANFSRIYVNSALVEFYLIKVLFCNRLPSPV